MFPFNPPPGLYLRVSAEVLRPRYILTQDGKLERSAMEIKRIRYSSANDADTPPTPLMSL